VKGTHVFEADIQVGVDSTHSVLKGNGHALSNLDNQVGMGR